MLARSVSIAALVFSFGCAPGNPEPGLSGTQVAPEVAVYALVVAHVGAADGSVAVEDQTVAYRPLPEGNWLLRGRAAVPRELVTQLARASAQTLQLDPQRYPRLPITARTVARTMAESALGGMTVIGVSPVAFSSDSAEALVFYEVRCGPICGKSAELWLERRGTNWLLRQEIIHRQG